MPKYFEFVAVAYGLWIVTFGGYFLHLFRRAARAAESLKALGGSGKDGGSSK